MRLSPLPVDTTKGFENADLFGYSHFADNLKLLVANVEKPLTIILDGKWGTGKSTFIKQWETLFSPEEASIVHFDAFAHDLHTDPFIALSSALLSHGQYTKEQKNLFIDKAKRIGSRLIPIATKVAVKAATLGVLGSNEQDEFLNAVAHTASDELGSLSEEVVAEQLMKAEKTSTLIEEFKLALSALATAEAPLIFIIDELDRCRPDFAIDVMECVKHLFTVPNICFIIVSNLEHLENSVKGKYGEAIDSGMYLQKFYNLKITLTSFKQSKEPEYQAYTHYLLDS